MNKKIVKVGDIVGFVLDEGSGKGDVRPAIVVRTWSEDCVQLQVFADGNGDETYNDGLPNVVWKTSIVYDAGKSPSSWHFLD